MCVEFFVQFEYGIQMMATKVRHFSKCLQQVIIKSTFCNVYSTKYAFISIFEGIRLNFRVCKGRLLYKGLLFREY